MDKLERYYGIKVNFSTNLEPFDIKVLKERAFMLSKLKDFKIEDFNVYYHQITLENVGKNFSKKFAIHDRIKLLDVIFSVNKKMAKHDMIKFYNCYVNSESKIGHIQNIESHLVKNIFTGLEIENNSVLQTELITFVKKDRISIKHKKIKVSIIAEPTDAYNAKLNVKDDFNPSDYDLALTHDVTIQLSENMHFENLLQDPNNRSFIIPHLPKVVILTAIKEEYMAVRNHLSEIEDCSINGIQYEAGLFKKDNELAIAKVFIRECGKGNAVASQEVERAIQNFHPISIFFVGIAASRKQTDFEIGDVIIPEKIYSYEGGKANKNSFSARPESEKLTYGIFELAKNERLKDDWKILINKNYDEKIKANIGVIASGDQLIENYDSATGNILSAYYNDTSAVDMESYGFIKATRRQGVLNAKFNAGVVRGISDIMEHGEDHNQFSEIEKRPASKKQLASDTAAAFAFWLVRKIHEII